MDGTLITSTAAAERVWTRWAERHGLDVAALLSVMHGVRAVDTIRRQNLPDIDLDAEVAWVERGEIEDVEGVAPIPGAVDFLKHLPPDRWAVVTSASVPLARARLKAAGVHAARRPDHRRGRRTWQARPGRLSEGRRRPGRRHRRLSGVRRRRGRHRSRRSGRRRRGGGDSRLDASAGDGPPDAFGLCGRRTFGRSGWIFDVRMLNANPA